MCSLGVGDRGPGEPNYYRSHILSYYFIIKLNLTSWGRAVPSSGQSVAEIHFYKETEFVLH
jgi:hypothetical protein